MNALTVLDLSDNYTITCLPDSLSDLRSLISLLLGGCLILKYVPPLGELKALSRLEISYTLIDQVLGLEELINLKWLNLRGNRRLSSIAGSVLRSLTNMQYLDLRDTRKVKGEDLGTMSMLERFAGSIQDCQNYNNYVGNTLDKGFGPKTYLIHLGNHLFSIPNDMNHRIVRFGDCEELTHLLPRDLGTLDISQNHHWTRLCGALKSNGPSSLQKIKIFLCEELKSLFCSFDSCSLCTNLQKLEALHVRDLGSLTAISKEDDANITPSLSPVGVFTHLKDLCIFGCHGIEKLLTPGLLPQLQNLQTLSVEDCDSMKEIFAMRGDGGGNDSITLPRLTRLMLYYLPQLKTVCKGTIVFGYAPRLDIRGCPNLESFPITIAQVVNASPSSGSSDSDSDFD